MTFNDPLKKLALTIFTIFSQLIISATSATAVGTTPPMTQCNIAIDDPHISESLIRTRGISAVKVNARSKCNKSMNNLVFTVEIYKIGFLRDYRVAWGELKVTGVIRPNTVVRNKKTFVECKNSRESRFYGIAYATALVDGKRRRTLHVITENTLPLPCGT
jgi:hypothetical protein